MQVWRNNWRERKTVFLVKIMLVVVGVEINEHINEIFKRGNNNREKLRMTSQCLP